MIRTTAYSRSKQIYKDRKRDTRRITSQSNFAKGMHYSNIPITDGFVKTLVNYDTKDSGSTLTPRPGIKQTHLVSLGFNGFGGLHFNENILINHTGTEYYEDVVGSFGSGNSGPLFMDYYEDPQSKAPRNALWMYAKDNEGIYRRFEPEVLKLESMVAGPAYNPVYSVLSGRLYSLMWEYTNTAEGQPHRLVKIQPKIVWDGSAEDYLYSREIITPKEPKVSEALSVGFNMLSEDPYTLEGQEDIVYQPLGILPYKPGTNELLLSANTGEEVEFKLLYNWAAGKNYRVKWEYVVATDDITVLENVEGTYSPGGTTFSITHTPTADKFAIRATLYEEDDPIDKEKVVVMPLYEMNNKQAQDVGFENIDIAKAKGMVSHNGALGLYNIEGYRNTIFFSDVGDPSYFPFPQNTHTFDTPILKVQPYLDNLLIITTEGMYIMSGGPLPTNRDVVKIQGNINFTEEELQTVVVYQNYVMYRSRGKIKLISPNRYYDSFTGMNIYDAGDNISELLEDEEEELLKIFKTMYSQDFIPDEKYLSVDFTGVEIVDKYADVVNGKVCFVSRAEISLDYEENSEVPTPSEYPPYKLYVNVIYRFDLESKAWDIYMFKTYGKVLFGDTAGTREDKMYTTDLAIVGDNSYFKLQFLEFNEDSKADTYEQQFSSTYFSNKNTTLLDTGGLAMDTEHKKRMREIQMHMYNKSEELLNFYTECRIDGAVNASYTKYQMVHEVDPSNPNYGLLTVVQVNEPNLNLLDLDGTISANEWILDSSRFAEQVQTKVRFKISGKGYLPQLIMISRNEKDYELAALSWVYRKMLAR